MQELIKILNNLKINIILYNNIMSLNIIDKI